MRTEAEKKLVMDLKCEGKSFQEIANIMKISRNSVSNLYYYDKNPTKMKRGPKFKIKDYEKLRIKRQIAQYRKTEEKINSPKIKKACYLNVSTRSIQRHLKCQGYAYKKSKFQICLSKKHKEIRLEIITKWISTNHPWERTVFSDEKRFSLGGPDDWRTYSLKSESIIRNKRQCYGGSVDGIAE